MISNVESMSKCFTRHIVAKSYMGFCISHTGCMDTLLQDYLASIVTIVMVFDNLTSCLFGV